MTSLFMTIARFIRVLKRSVKDSEFRKLFLVVFALLVSGSLFYHFVEGWRYLDALYFSVTTLTTVGSPIIPYHDVSKIFTIIYLLVGIGVMLSFLARVAEQAKKESSVAKAMAIESYETTKHVMNYFGRVFDEKKPKKEEDISNS